jgi:hypothetical protein
MHFKIRLSFTKPGILGPAFPQPRNGTRAFALQAFDMHRAFLPSLTLHQISFDPLLAQVQAPLPGANSDRLHGPARYDRRLKSNSTTRRPATGSGNGTNGGGASGWRAHRRRRHRRRRTTAAEEGTRRGPGPRAAPLGTPLCARPRGGGGLCCVRLPRRGAALRGTLRRSPCEAGAGPEGGRSGVQASMPRGGAAYRGALGAGRGQPAGAMRAMGPGRQSCAAGPCIPV